MRKVGRRKKATEKHYLNIEILHFCQNVNMNMQQCVLFIGTLL